MSETPEPIPYQRVLSTLTDGQEWVYEGPLTVRQFLRGLRLDEDLGHLEGLLEDAFGGQDTWSEYETPVRLTLQRLGPTIVTIDGGVGQRNVKPSEEAEANVIAALEALPGVDDDREERQQRTARLRRVTFNPEVCNGQPTVRGLSVTAASVLDLLASGSTVEQVLADHPSLDRDDILGVLEYAAVRAQADRPGAG